MPSEETLSDYIALWISFAENLAREPESMKQQRNSWMIQYMQKNISPPIENLYKFFTTDRWQGYNRFIYLSGTALL